MHPLDNVIWQALTTRQAHFAETYNGARRFVPEVTLLSAFEQPSDHNYAALGELIGPGATAAVFLEQPYEPRGGWDFVAGAPLLQMVCENGPTAIESSKVNILELGLADSSDMLELTALTKPGPFGPRTHELGSYVGVRQSGKLVAMAGERLKVLGHTEVSAVCTHPDHVGKGYAGVLMLEIMRGIRQRGEIPFLHVRQDNTRAVQLYERLGFRTTKLTHFAVLRHAKNTALRRSQTRPYERL